MTRKYYAPCCAGAFGISQFTIPTSFSSPPSPSPHLLRLLSDLGDTLALLAELTALEPGLTADLLQQSVTFGPRGHHHHTHHQQQQQAAGATRSWTDVVAGILALGPQVGGGRGCCTQPPPCSWGGRGGWCSHCVKKHKQKAKQ